MKKIRKGDQVLVISGKDKGKKGIVLSFDGKDRLVVKGVAMVVKAVRPNPSRQIQGGLSKKESSIHISNVALWDDEAQKRSKVGFRMSEDGKKERFFKATGNLVTVL